MMRPMPIPIAPPIRVPSSQTSTLRAQPSACSSARVRRSSCLGPGGRRGRETGFRHARLRSTGAYGVDAAFMPFHVHERGIHIV